MCQRAGCESERIASVGGKTSDMCHVNCEGFEHDGYVPEGLGIGSGDYLNFSYCLDCGQMQGTFPIPTSAMRDVMIVEISKRLRYLRYDRNRSGSRGTSATERTDREIASLEDQLEALEASEIQTQTD